MYECKILMVRKLVWAGIENYTIIINIFTVCAAGAASMFPVV
jgi:hypothetical protein